MDSGAAGARRKAKTYGKASHRDRFIFDVPASPSDSEDELQSSPAVSIRDMQASKASRMVHSITPVRKQTVQRKGIPEGPKSTGDSSEQGVLSGTATTDDFDIFDVPLADEDNARLNSPLKPAIKRRKVPGKDANGTLISSTGKPSGRTSKGRNMMGDSTTLDDAPRAPPSKLLSPFQMGKASKAATTASHGSTANSLHSKEEATQTDGTKSPRLETFKRKAPTSNEVDIPQSNLLSASRMLGKGKATEARSSKDSRAELKAKPRTMPAAMPAHHAQASAQEPRTPPAERRVNDTLSSNASESGPISAFSFMSPSGLDFLGLDISAAPNDQNRKLESTPATSLKAKLKDRLAKRNGAVHSDSDGDHFLEVEAPEATSEIDDITAGDSERAQTSNFKPREEQASNSQPPNSAIPQVTMGTGPRHTYAARTRTFRKDENATEDDILSSLTEIQETPSSGTRRIRLEPQVKGSQDTAKDSLDFEDVEDSQSSTLRNIHELREAGANARLQGETEVTLDEIDSSSQSTRRNGLLCLLNKLENKAFRDKFSANSLEGRLLARIDEDIDLVSKVLLAMSLLRVLAVQASAQTLAQYKEYKSIGFIESLLSETESLKAITRNRKSNTSKAFQSETEEVCWTYMKSTLWRLGTPSAITPRTAALHLLDYLTRHMRKGGATGELLPRSTARILTEILESFVDLPDFSGDDPDLLVAISVLETSTMGLEGASVASWQTQLIRILAELLLKVCRVYFEQGSPSLSLSLRLGLNLTNNNPSNCALFDCHEVLNAVTSIVENLFNSIWNNTDPQSLSAATVDNLILSLGFLINLAENSRSARLHFKDAGGSSRSPLDVLLQIFTSSWVKAFEVRKPCCSYLQMYQLTDIRSHPRKSSEAASP